MLSDGGDSMSVEGLQLHAIRFMQALDAAVDDLDDLARQVAPMFINLGRRHIYFKVSLLNIVKVSVKSSMCSETQNIYDRNTIDCSLNFLR